MLLFYFDISTKVSRLISDKYFDSTTEKKNHVEDKKI